MIGIPYRLPTHVSLGRLWSAVNKRRPQNGFTRSAFVEAGWTAQPDYAHDWEKS